MDGYDLSEYQPVSTQDEYCIKRDLIFKIGELKGLFSKSE